MSIDAIHGKEKWSQASFRISGDELRPDQIGAILGLESTGSGVKGERFSARHNAVRRTSFWLLKSPLSDSLPLEEHLKWLLDQLEPKLELIHSVAKQWRSEFFCGFGSENGQGGITFDSVLMRRIADMGVPLVLDLHPAEDNTPVNKEQS